MSLRICSKLCLSRNLKLHHFSNRFFNSQDLIDSQANFLIVSESKDIFTNLALEDWIYQKCSFGSDRRALLLWHNQPCIVIGRHQNPWAECDVKWCLSNNLPIVRRNSGGGTVYHDLGNLNLSFLTHKSNYDRKGNLGFIKVSLEKHFQIESEINARQDLVLASNQRKISGTAAKLSSKNAYHHCTLLVDVQLDRLRSAIRKDLDVSMRKCLKLHN